MEEKNIDTPQRRPTPAEAELEHIFNNLGGGALNGEFVREWPLGNWLIDFYFPAIKLAVEVDGGYHRAPLQWRRDLHKTAELEAHGITVLRLTNAEVFGERARLIEKLRAAWRVAQEQTSARTNTRSNNSGGRFEAREPAAPGYAVTLIIDMGSIESIFAEEIALTKQWAANTARRAVNTALLASMTGVEMVHVPFKGEGPAPVELLAGRVELFFGNISAVLKFREGNRAKLLGLAAPKRGSIAPDQPTVAESGVAEFVASAWFAIVAPPGTPVAIAQKLNATVADLLKLPDVQRKFAAQGAEVSGGTSAEMISFLEAERTRWKKVIDTARVTLD